MRWRLWFVAITVFALLISVFLYWSPKDDLPTYQGRTLRQWLNDNSDAYSPGTPASLIRDAVIAASEIAVARIGTNAIPSLLKMLAVSETSFKEKSFIFAQIVVNLHRPYPEDEQMLAVHGFEMLGNVARPAIPGLIKLTHHKDRKVRGRALECLWIITRGDKEILLPVLLNLVQDSDWRVQMQAASILSGNFPEEAEKASVYTMFPNMRSPGTNVIRIR